MTTKTDTTLYINGHRKWYVAGFIVSVLLLALTTYAAQTHKVAGWESRLFFDVNNWPERQQHIFSTISLLGGSVWAAVGAVVITFCMKLYRLCWRLSASIVGAYAIAFVAKHVVGRARPAGLLEHVHVRAVESGMGFPSGHATIVTVIMLTILPYLPRRWRWLVLAVIAAVAVSRLYLGVHLPLDVVGGVCVGTMVVSFVRIMPQSLRVFLRLD